MKRKKKKRKKKRTERMHVWVDAHCPATVCSRCGVTWRVARTDINTMHGPCRPAEDKTRQRQRSEPRRPTLLSTGAIYA